MKNMILTTLMAMCLAACSSQMSVDELAPDAVHVDGIPFRSREPFVVRVYQREPDGSYRSVYEERHFLPDPERLYVLRYLGLPLADMTANVTIRPDSTLQTVGLKDTSKADEALDAAGRQLDALAKRITEIETVEASQRTSELDAELNFQRAMLAVQEAQLALDRQIEGTADWEAASLNLRKARIDVNDKARRAGIAPPFPEMSF
jgi:hypothetical protein